MKKNYFPILLSLLTIFIFNQNLMGLPTPVKDIQGIDYKELSKKEIEKNLGRKLKFKEKITLGFVNKGIKKTKKASRRNRVNIKLFDGGLLKGHITNIQNDSIFLNNYVKKGNIKSKVKRQRGKEIGVPLKNVNNIRIKSLSRKNKLVNAIAFFVLSILVIFLGKKVQRVGDLQASQTNPDSTTTGYGVLLTRLGMIGALIGLIIVCVLAHKESSTLKVNGDITQEQVEVLKDYYVD